DFAPGELVREGVLFIDLRVAPAARPIELRHHHRAVFQPDLVDAVLVAIEAQQAPVGAQAGRGDAIEHHIWRQARIRMRVQGYDSAPWTTRSRFRICISRTAISRSSAACRCASRRGMSWR